MAEFAGNVDYTNLTASATIDGTLPEVWSREIEDYLTEQRHMRFFTVEKRDLVRQPGDKINIQRRTALTATGNLTETTVLQGNEEKLSYQNVAYTPAERGNAVIFSGQANAKSILDLRNEAKFLLGDWAAKKNDTDAIAAMEDLPGAQIRYGGAGNTKQADLADADKITLALVQKTKGEMEGANVPKYRSVDPELNEFLGSAAPMDGFYVLILHPYQAYDLSQDSDYKTAVQQAGSGIVTGGLGKSVGPFFSGWVTGWVDGVLILKTTNISFESEGYATKVARGFMFGPRFLGRAVGLDTEEGPAIRYVEQVFDYGRSIGIAATWFDQYKLLNTNRIYGVYTAATDLAA